MFYRRCPKCEKEITYKLEVTRNRANKKNSVCQSCANREIGNRPEVKEKNIARMKEYYSHESNRRLISERQSKRIGELNSFYGKHHTEESKIKMVMNKNYDYTKTYEFAEKCRRVGSDNGMYGRSFYDIWVKKYGEDVADELMTRYRLKKSESSSGVNNSMYGKTPPIGSGNGWSGWYKGWYFRSLGELSYVIHVIESNGYEWRTAETKDLVIQYRDENGNHRTYRADFLINERLLVEVKPEKLMNTKINQMKRKAAEIFCCDNGLEYRMVHQEVMSFGELKQLHDNGDIIFVEKWEERYKKMLKKQML